eukprot:1865533-Prymnesium_polylepis.2
MRCTAPPGVPPVSRTRPPDRLISRIASATASPDRWTMAWRPKTGETLCSVGAGAHETKAALAPICGRKNRRRYRVGDRFNAPGSAGAAVTRDRTAAPLRLRSLQDGSVHSAQPQV